MNVRRSIELGIWLTLNCSKDKFLWMIDFGTLPIWQLCLLWTELERNNCNCVLWIYVPLCTRYSYLNNGSWFWTGLRFLCRADRWLHRTRANTEKHSNWAFWNVKWKNVENCIILESVSAENLPFIFRRRSSYTCVCYRSYRPVESKISLNLLRRLV